MKKALCKFQLILVIFFLTSGYLFDHNAINASSFSPQSVSRDGWQQSEKIMDAVGIKPGMVIGEAGAGDGYFTFKLSKRIGKIGKIYANDIVEKGLKKIRERCKREGINNIETILGKEKNPLFPEGKLDMVIMVYVFHELKHPAEFFENVKLSLKPGAKIVVVDRDPEKYGYYSTHFLKKDEILRRVKNTGFELEKIETFLPRDNIYIFQMKGTGSPLGNFCTRNHLYRRMY